MDVIHDYLPMCGHCHSIYDRFKLNSLEISQVRDLIACGLFSQNEIARMYGVTKTTIQKVRWNRVDIIGIMEEVGDVADWEPR